MKYVDHLSGTAGEGEKKTLNVQVEGKNCILQKSHLTEPGWNGNAGYILIGKEKSPVGRVVRKKEKTKAILCILSGANDRLHWESSL